MEENVNVFSFTSVDGEVIELEYDNYWFIENNGIELFLNADKNSVSELSELFPLTPFSGVFKIKNVEASEFSIHNDLICQRISLNMQLNQISIYLPGLTEEAKRYLELTRVTEQLQANLDYVAMETMVDL